MARLRPRDVRRYTYYADGQIAGVAMRHLPTGIYTGLQPTLDDADRVLRACLTDHEAGIAAAGTGTGVAVQDPGVFSGHEQAGGLYVKP